MRFLINWLDRRTGVREITREALYENVPGGSRWRYVWGSTLTFCLAVQFITGIFLWMHYSPSVTSAWESVFYIQNELNGGWLLRGIHHFTADVMLVLLVLHLMQVVIDGAYKAPREVNFWFGVALLLLVLALALTGYLLPWDQKGYWATSVATNIMGITPLVGPYLQRLVIGGAEYGHLTLTRFFALHAGVLPALVVLLVFGHLYLFRRHGITPKEPLRKRDEPFWPDQLLKDGVASLAVLAAILFLVFKNRLFVGSALGAELAAPADPAEPYSAARPEWYFLFLFQWLKYCNKDNFLLQFLPEEHLEVFGAIVLPGLIVLLIVLMPFFGNIRAGRFKLGHGLNVLFLFALISAVCALTGLAVWEDNYGPNSAEIIQAKQKAAEEAERVKQLALGPEGIPVSGAVTLLREDPRTRGPKLFAAHCASCHRFNGHDGLGHQPSDPQIASDLAGFATREWLTGLLDPAQIATTNYFGGTKFVDGKMVKFVREDVANFDDEKKAALKKVILAVSAEAHLKSQEEIDRRDAELIKQGQERLVDTLGCVDCHEYEIEDDTATAPVLTGYGSRDWLITMISNPEHPKFYGDKNERMPSFAEEGILTDQEIGILADWLRGEWYEPEDTALVSGRDE